MIDFYGSLQRTIEKDRQRRIEEKNRKEGRLTIQESHAALRKNFDSLAENSKTTIDYLSKSRGFHVMLKFKDRAESNQKDAVLMYILSNENTRPLQGKPFSLGVLKRVNQAIDEALYKGFRPLDKRDIGRPLTTDEPDVVIDEQSFGDEDVLYNLTRDTFYSTDDYETVVERAQSATAQFEQEGRERGLIVD